MSIESLESFPKGVVNENLPSREIEGAELLWNIFGEISQIPRKTAQEQQIIEYQKVWAEKEHYPFEIDGMGNMLIFVPASQGYENVPGVILQAHNDMVCEGNPNPEKFGVTLVPSEDGKTLRANNTSAGFDNGIGVAAALALTQDSTLMHGPLALMMTVNEEVGVLGAMKMDFKSSLEKYKFMLNLDSEDEGIGFISCAGGGDTVISLPIEREPHEGPYYHLSIKNLTGGHSGVDIDKNKINGIKVLSQVLNRLSNQVDSFKLAKINGGTARNAIPYTKLGAILSVHPDDLKNARQIVKDVTKLILAETINDKDKGLKMSLRKRKYKIKSTFTEDTTSKLLEIIDAVPSNVIKMSDDVEGLVETSNNLSIVKTYKKRVVIQTMTRSSVDADIHKVRKLIKEIAVECKAKAWQPKPYPGWKADPNSPIIPIATAVWKELTDKELKIAAIHAGLESGVIISKYPFLKAISIGPEVKEVHTPSEWIDVKSVSTFYTFMRNIISTIAETNKLST